MYAVIIDAGRNYSPAEGFRSNLDSGVVNPV